MDSVFRLQESLLRTLWKSIPVNSKNSGSNKKYFTSKSIIDLQLHVLKYKVYKIYFYTIVNKWGSRQQIIRAPLIMYTLQLFMIYDTHC